MRHLTQLMQNRMSTIFPILIIFMVMTMLFDTSVALADPLVPCSGTLAAGEPVQPGGGCDFTDIIALINNVINFLIFKLAVPLAAISFAIAGVMILTAGGNTGQVEKAKDIFWNVFWGLIIALSAWLVVTAILVALGAKWPLGVFG